MLRAGATSLAANPLTSQLVADSMQGMATIAFNHSGQQKLSRIQEYAANLDRAFLSDEDMNPLALCSFAATNSVIIKGLQVLRTFPHIIQAGCLKNMVMEVEPQAGM